MLPVRSAWLVSALARNRSQPAAGTCATPLWNDGVVEFGGVIERTESGFTPTSMFTEAARVLARHVAEMGLDVPGFRTPPRTVGVNRTLRRSPDGSGGVVAVRLADRPFTAVIGDMIEGVIVLNQLAVADADRARTHLWRLMLKFTVEATPSRRRDGSYPRVA